MSHHAPVYGRGPGKWQKCPGWPSLNLQADQLLSAVAERLLKAMRKPPSADRAPVLCPYRGDGLAGGGFGPKARLVSRWGRLVRDRARWRSSSFAPSSL